MFLDSKTWKLVQDSVPIACVDVLPLQTTAGVITHAGLIHRDTPHQGPRWCFVGGRLHRNETLVEGLTRQLRETLGDAVRFTAAPDLQPLFVAQYFTQDRGVGALDPRQHAVALSYALAVDGDIAPAGEAHDFRWFELTALPAPAEWGFEQDRVAVRCLARLGLAHAFV